jgi:hypothetical protein
MALRSFGSLLRPLVFGCQCAFGTDWRLSHEVVDVAVGFTERPVFVEPDEDRTGDGFSSRVTRAERNHEGKQGPEHEQDMPRTRHHPLNQALGILFESFFHQMFKLLIRRFVAFSLSQEPQIT